MYNMMCNWMEWSECGKWSRLIFLNLQFSTVTFYSEYWEGKSSHAIASDGDQFWGPQSRSWFWAHWSTWNWWGTVVSAEWLGPVLIILLGERGVGVGVGLTLTSPSLMHSTAHCLDFSVLVHPMMSWIHMRKAIIAINMCINTTYTYTNRETERLINIWNDKVF